VIITRLDTAVSSTIDPLITTEKVKILYIITIIPLKLNGDLFVHLARGTKCLRWMRNFQRMYCYAKRMHQLEDLLDDDNLPETKRRLSSAGDLRPDNRR
jgi:hypothetical protein